jgi:phosphatidylglycerol:prolipoprotein diacylglycerol transferase
MLFYLYGFFIALGILAAMAIIEHLKRFLNTKYNSPAGELNTSVFDLFPWILAPGLIGARIYHVVDYWSYYSPDLKQIFFVWQGGLGIYGGIMGGIVGLFFYAFLLALRSPVKNYLSLQSHANQLNKQLSYRRDALKTKTKQFLLAPRAFINIVLQNTLGLLDFVALGLPIGQAIGRLGNYFNQELYGLPTNLPWGIYIRPENRLPGWENFAKFQPLFLYEALWCMLIFLSLYYYMRAEVGHKNFSVPGQYFFLYLFLYSFGRFWLEFLRIDGWIINGLRMNQLVAVVGMLLATLFFIKYRLQFPRKFSNILFGQ